MSQLRKQSKELQRDLDNVSKSLNPGEYKNLEDQLSHVNGRIAELRQNAKSFTELAASDGVNNFFYGQVGYKALELFGSKLGELRDSVRELTNEGVIIRKTKRSKKVRRSVPTRKTKRSFFSSPSTRKTPQKNLRRFTFLIHYISDIQIKSHSLVTTEQQLCTLYIILIYVYVAQVQGYALQG